MQVSKGPALSFQVCPAPGSGGGGGFLATKMDAILAMSEHPLSRQSFGMIESLVSKDHT